MKIPPAPKSVAFIAYLGEDAKIEAMKLASRLRQAGIAVIKATGSKSLKGQLRQANSLGTNYSIIIGEEEVKNQTVVLRDMINNKQNSIAIAKVALSLKQNKPLE